MWLLDQQHQHQHPWGLVRKADSLPLSQPHRTRRSGGGAQQAGLISPLRDSDAVMSGNHGSALINAGRGVRKHEHSSWLGHMERASHLVLGHS